MMFLSFFLPQHRAPMLCPRVQKSAIFIARFSVQAIGMFMPNINNVIFSFNKLNSVPLSLQGQHHERRRGRAGGPAAGQGILGGSPKNPSGGHSRALVPPEGGVGGRKSGIQYCINWRVFAQRTGAAVERFSTSIAPREKTVFFENFKKMSLLASKTP